MKEVKIIVNFYDIFLNLFRAGVIYFKVYEHVWPSNLKICLAIAIFLMFYFVFVGCDCYERQ